MTRWTFIRRSLRFHARAHLGVVLGAAIAAAALTGALLVGDSLRQTLVDRALSRLGGIDLALDTRDRLFLDDLGRREDAPPIGGGVSSTGLLMPAVAAAPSGVRLNHVNVLGVDSEWPALAQWGPRPESPGGAVDLGQLDAWRAGQVALVNRELADRLAVKTGDEILLRLDKPSALSRDAFISPRDQSTVAFRVKVGLVLMPETLGNFSLIANQLPPANVFLPLDVLQQRLGLGKRANLLVARPERTRLEPTEQTLASAQAALAKSWQLEDAQLTLTNFSAATTNGQAPSHFVELSSSRIFLEPQVVEAALRPTRVLSARDLRLDDSSFLNTVTNGAGVLTYLANLLEAGEHATPYSMVTAAGVPLVPPDMADDEILVNDWLARDLQVKPGDPLRLSYYVADSGAQLLQRTNVFKVRAIVPLQGIYADRSLMPEFPGLAKAESTHDWDAGFPLVYTIRPQDEAYWKQYRGTPKAFVTLAAGQKLWSNRFGNLTAIRWPLLTNGLERVASYFIRSNLQANLDPAAAFGFRFQPVRDLALRAASQSQDFGQLFIGFSLFLIVAALLLMALLFQFALEQRATETGTLLALGFTPRLVRRLYLREGLVLSLAGSVLGTLGGIVYAKAMLWALVTHWRSAVGTSVLEFHSSPDSLAIGSLGGTAIATITIVLALRKQARQPAAALLAGEISSSPVVLTPGRAGSPLPAVAGKSTSGGQGTDRPTLPRPGLNWAFLSCVVSLIAGVALLAWSFAKGASNPGAFFGAGSLLLIAGLTFLSWRLSKFATPADGASLTVAALGLRGIARRRSRSVASVALLACGTFVIVSIGAFRLDSNLNASQPKSGTGGFALLAESTLPILQDLNTRSGREAIGLNEDDLPGVRVVAFRVRQGEDASCLNLNRAQTPRLLGVKPDLLQGRFTFAQAAEGSQLADGWQMLRKAGAAPDEVPAIGDAASIQWALGKKIGDRLDYTDEHGHSFKLRLVGALANSILQGSLVIDEEAFTKKFPSESGYRYLLLDASAGSHKRVSSALSRALEDSGLEIGTTVARLNALNAVQNTYLGTFQILGGLGLLLGSAGLGVVVLRNVLERRGELALLTAVGFRRQSLHRLVLCEHGALLALGLLLGLVTALVAVVPSLLVPGGQMPFLSLGLTLLGVVLNGALWTWLATRYALSGNLLAALRNE